MSGQVSQLIRFLKAKDSTNQNRFKKQSFLEAVFKDIEPWSNAFNAQSRLFIRNAFPHTLGFLFFLRTAYPRARPPKIRNPLPRGVSAS